VLVLFAAIYWCAPLLLGPGYLAICRAESVLLPIVPLVCKLPVVLLLLLVLIALALSIQIGPLFFRGVLV